MCLEMRGCDICRGVYGYGKIRRSGELILEFRVGWMWEGV